MKSWKSRISWAYFCLPVLLAFLSGLRAQDAGRRFGHYFRPAYRTAAGKGLIEPAGPIIRPDGRAHQWSLHYSPQPEGHGVIRLQLDQEVQTFTVCPEHRKTGASFDRFGLFNLQVGGHFVDLAVRDLTYTARPGRR